MAGELIAVIDAGTSSVRAIAFDGAGRQVALARRDLAQHYPQSGWVEQDPRDIRDYAVAVLAEVVSQAGGAGRFAALGLTNQRETLVAWDRNTREPLARAIVWQDRRTADACAALREAGHEELVQSKTGLVLDPYFSATKMRWLLDNEPAVAGAASAGRLVLGTVDAWLIACLTGELAIEAGNASRTSLYALDSGAWDEGLCDLFGVPRQALPPVVDSAGQVGVTDAATCGMAFPLTGIAGDQQAATIGQGCLSPGRVKATYGTGAFALAYAGEAPPTSRHRLLATELLRIGSRRSFALEGAVFTAGSLIRWMRDSLGVIDGAPETEAMATSVADSGGVVIVPALSGLGAPHWDPDARAAFVGMSHATTRDHLARAALEAMAHQTQDLAEAFAADGASWELLRIDGGMSRNDWMAQDLADILSVPVERPDNVETTALGAAMLAGLGAGAFATLDEAAREMRGASRRFEPDMAHARRDARLDAWRTALSKV